MRKNLNKTKSLLFSGAALAFVLLLGGCEQNFFVSPSELLTPSPDTKPTVIIQASATPEKKVTPTPEIKITPSATPTITPTPEPTDTPAPTDTPTPTYTPTPIPTVATDFIVPVTDPSDYTFLVNREHPLSENYEPDDLVKISHSLNPTSSEDKYKLRSYAATAFDEMCDDAFQTKGLNIVGVSGYRSYDRQYNLYAGYLVRDGISHTNYYSAQPGTSEHQSGLAIDISCQSCGYDLVNSFAKSPEGKWVSDNAWRYGFILRYSEDDVDITGYAYEPWHIRYVGIPLAYYLYNSGLTLEEYYNAPSDTSREYLDSTPLIDTSDVRFGNIYIKEYSDYGTLVYTDETKTHVLINKSTYMPYILPFVISPTGVVEKDFFGKTYYAPPVTNFDGQVYPNKDSIFVLVKPALYINGFLWNDSAGNPFFLDPLVSWMGELVRDENDNVIFKKVLMTPDGSTFVPDDAGMPIMLTPKRASDGELIFNAQGEVEYYLPVTNGLGQYRRDTNGDLIWPSDYETAREMELQSDLMEESPLYTIEEPTYDTETTADVTADIQ
ncbi:MAG: M15 family metallopeptidase [Lachnospiraceae bacterium]|nr:M15 family metallopeptidase [Lachnospiraceae bacterium]